ncbi:MAG: 16S rRNA (cytosine(1402)-N(4))-methyltransferase, partial [Gemmatimonadota bacterium]
MTTRFDSAYHAPVLVDEILDLFAGATRALDCTLGGGGHSAAMLDAGIATVTGVDRDPEAIAEAAARLRPAIEAGRFNVVRGNFADVAEQLSPGVTFDAILLDLGVSS